MGRGIADRPILGTPIAILDFETTGLSAGADRVVEIAIVRVDPGGEPRLVLDTLVNPQRRVAATDIHGIADEDVANAPRFCDIAGDVVSALNDCVVAAYNVYFDIKFLNSELFSVGIDHEPPHFCLLYLRPMLGLGSRCKLEVVCQEQGILYQATHVAAHDAMASASLLRRYLQEATHRGIGNFGGLASLKRYKFVDSFDLDPLPDPARFGLGRCNRFLSRSGQARQADDSPERSAIAAYWDTLKAVIADLDVTDEEMANVANERQRLGLSTEKVRSMHARIYAAVIRQITGEQLDDKKAARLRRLHQCLSQLGWAPGE
jgi:DNA polymerase III epsilon subunit-like protein